MPGASSQVDVAWVGAGLGAAAAAVGLTSWSGSGVGWLLVVGAAVPLLIRPLWRSMPMWLLLAATVTPIIATESFQTSETAAAWLIGCVACGTAAIERRTAAAWIPILLAAGGPVWVRLGGAVYEPEFILAIWLMGQLLSVTLGTIVGQQRRLIASLQQAQQQLAESAAASERQRIARELHDVVGHSFSVVMLHLAGARHLLSTDPEGATSALRQAEDVGRTSMDNLRRSLAVLGSADAAHEPVGDLSALDRLADSMRTAGLDVSLSTSGDVASVDAVASVAVYGVAREALTNAAKHAAPGPVECRLSIDTSVALTVTNRTKRADQRTQGAPGVGVVGMTERAHAAGGTLSIEDRNGTWSVCVDIPLGQQSNRDELVGS